MRTLVFQIRCLVIATAIGLVLALGLGSLSLASVGCNNPDHAEAVQLFDPVGSPMPWPGGDDARTGYGCCGPGAMASCCHSGGVVLGDRLTSMHRLPGRTDWMPLHGSILTSVLPEVGRHPPRLRLLAL